MAKKIFFLIITTMLLLQTPAWCEYEYSGYFRKEVKDKSIIQEFFDWFKNPLNKEEKPQKGYFRTLE